MDHKWIIYSFAYLKALDRLYSPFGLVKQNDIHLGKFGPVINRGFYRILGSFSRSNGILLGIFRDFSQALWKKNEHDFSWFFLLIWKPPAVLCLSLMESIFIEFFLATSPKSLVLHDIDIIMFSPDIIRISLVKLWSLW